jgi:23S rRNA (uridine2552-2'-O)-methyltransferase
MRLIEAKKEYYRTLAKKDGYRSRSAYKLAQLDNSYHIFKSKSNVVDIGSSPGGWLQVAKQKVGENAMVIGIDLKHIYPLQGVITLQGSITDSEVIDEVLKLVGGKVDIVLSDLSPNMSGIWDLDHARQISLTRAALSASVRLLKRDGISVFKVFEGELLERLKKEMRCHFRRVYSSKPKASRQRSSEQYLVCLDFTLT